MNNNTINLRNAELEDEVINDETIICEFCGADIEKDDADDGVYSCPVCGTVYEVGTEDDAPEFTVELAADMHGMRICYDEFEPKIDTDEYRDALGNIPYVPGFIDINENSIEEFRDWLNQNDIDCMYITTSSGVHELIVKNTNEQCDFTQTFSARGTDPCMTLYILLSKIKQNIDDVRCPDNEEYIEDETAVIEETAFQKKLCTCPLIG